MINSNILFYYHIFYCFIFFCDIVATILMLFTKYLIHSITFSLGFAIFFIIWQTNNILLNYWNMMGNNIPFNKHYNHESFLMRRFHNTKFKKQFNEHYNYTTMHIIYVFITNCIFFICVYKIHNFTSFYHLVILLPNIVILMILTIIKPQI